MLLIDASNISTGGGSTLLKYLIEELESENRPHHVVAPARTGLIASQRVSICPVLNPLRKGRQTLLTDLISHSGADRVLFFGNIPSPMPIDEVRTFTYFQNALLLKQFSRSIKNSWKNRVRFWLLQRFIRLRLNHCDHWFFQTEHIQNCFLEEYGLDKDAAHVFPFFDLRYLNEFKSQASPAKEPRPEFVYLSDGYSHKNHDNLILAWRRLNEIYSRQPILHLTVSQPNLIKMINDANQSGCQIVNHGLLPREEALKLVAETRYTIFPSRLETIGLGLIEGALLNSEVLCSDFAGFAEVIEPTASFDPLDIDAIAQTVSSRLDSGPISGQPRVLLKNLLPDMIRFIFDQ